jgi:FtsX-like permease family protein
VSYGGAVYSRLTDLGVAAIPFVFGVLGPGAHGTGWSLPLSAAISAATRESALLRALGLTRRGLRWMISMEAVLLGLMGAVAGVAFGVGFGWATGRAFLRTDGGPVSYPILQIAGYIALAAVAGLLASVIPARRAARLTVIDGLSAELPGAGTERALSLTSAGRVPRRIGSVRRRWAGPRAGMPRVSARIS